MHGPEQICKYTSRCTHLSTGCLPDMTVLLPDADGKGDEMLLAKLEAWVKGGPSAAPHLHFLCYLLQSSLAAQRQLLDNSALAQRYLLQ